MTRTWKGIALAFGAWALAGGVFAQELASGDGILGGRSALAGLSPRLEASELFGQGPGAAGLFEAGPGPALGAFPALSLGLGDDEVANYIALRAGPFWFLNDLEDLDVGYDVEVAFGWQPINLFALEIYSGAIHGEDDSGSDQAELWAVPFGARAQVLIPLFVFLRLYAGVGAAGYYVASDVDVGAFSDDENDVGVGGEGFVGLRFKLTRLLLGIEGKYMKTSEVDVGPARLNIEGVAALAWIGIRF